MSIKMIALDLDGTTLNGWRLTENTQKTLEAAIEKGVHVVIATGRTYSSLPEEIFKIKGLEYILKKNKFSIFAIYTLILGVLVFAEGIYELFAGQTIFQTIGLIK